MAQPAMQPALFTRELTTVENYMLTQDPEKLMLVGTITYTARTWLAFLIKSEWHDEVSSDENKASNFFFVFGPFGIKDSNLEWFSKKKKARFSLELMPQFQAADQERWLEPLHEAFVAQQKRPYTELSHGRPGTVLIGCDPETRKVANLFWDRQAELTQMRSQCWTVVDVCGPVVASPSSPSSPAIS